MTGFEPLESEVTAIPSEPQLLPKTSELCFNSFKNASIFKTLSSRIFE